MFCLSTMADVLVLYYLKSCLPSHALYNKVYFKSDYTVITLYSPCVLVTFTLSPHMWL